MSSDEDDELFPLANIQPQERANITLRNEATDAVKIILNSLISSISMDSIPEGSSESIDHKILPLKRKRNVSEFIHHRSGLQQFDQHDASGTL
ncbi:hypothetical protein PoB_000906200 [Plakobranchus ocellatus]|uniref:Uncharacterized protein n=1 Tax=Plakobranchus ocellatus TaxID=259542 RepID=A0AAV3YJJ7_9GAST|nr:hypothetical protein PoB_000906200 [Plakobranchus ocellatus]